MKRFLPPLLIHLICSVAAAAAADQWPQWRGPDRTGRVAEGVVVPDKLPPDLKVVWHEKIGFGLSSPLVAGGKVFYLDNQKEKETAHAADAASGKEIWGAELDDTFKDGQSAPGPRCTPILDDGHIYAQSSRGELKCLGIEDGHVIWRTNYSKDFGATFTGEKGSAEGSTRHGNTDSPLIDGDHLIAGVGGKAAGYVCFDKLTGKVIWKSEDEIPAYAAPFIATIAGTRQMLAFTTKALIGINVADGKVLWQYPVKTSLGRHATTPTVVDDIVVVGSFQAGLIGVRVSKADGVFKAERAWLTKDSAMNFSSPIAVGEYLYGAGPSLNLFCLEAKTGKQVWSKDAGIAKQYVGLIVLGKNILALGDSGDLVLFAADPKAYVEQGRAKACEKNWCLPAYVGGKLYLRDDYELRCLQLLAE